MKRAFTLAEGTTHVAMSKDYSKNAFTLAEVLITLGIIGVVAALTMPALIQNHKKSETSARLKKFYSTMSQAILLSQQDNESIENWDMVTPARDEQGNYDYASNSNISKNFFNKYIASYIQYTKVEDGKNYLDENGVNIGGENFTIYLTDGSVFSIKNSGCMDFIYDVNGQRKSNVAGKDVYRFLLCPQQTFRKLYCRSENSFFCAYYLNSDEENSRDKMINDCKTTPISCSGLLEQDNWVFKDDYPYRL